MGGSLLNNIWGLPPRRFSKEEFDFNCDRIKRQLELDFPDRRVDFPKFVKNKPDFGDIDCQIESKSGDNIDWMAYLKKFSGFKPHKNGHVISVPLWAGQCDFIFVGSENFDSMMGFFSYESGNLVGNIATPIGFRYGFDGLRLKIPLSEFDSSLPSHEYKEISITKDTKEIHEILGFDNDKFNSGFESHEDLFEWVVNSRYFNSRYFQLESLNHQNRTRNKRRNTFMKFLEYCKEFPEKEKIDRNKLRQEIRDRYSHIPVRMRELSGEIVRLKERKQKFNGDIITEIRGLSGKDLGDFIIRYKQSKPDFISFLDNTSSVDIVEDIKKFPYA